MAISVSSTAAQTPAGRSFSSIKREVLDFVQATDSPRLNDIAGRAVNSAIDRVNIDVWEWLLTRETLTLVADDPDYPMATAHKKSRALFRLNTSSERDGRLSYLEPKVMYNEYPRAVGSGDPHVYTVRYDASAGWVVFFNRPPSSSFVTLYPTMEHHYYARMQRFAGDSETLGDLKAPPELAAYLVWQGRHAIATIHGLSSSLVREAKFEAARIYNDLRRDNNDTMPDWE
jgi:hypothetical protein